MKIIILIIFTIYLNATNTTTENERLHQRLINTLEQKNPLIEIDNMINKYRKDIALMKKGIWETNEDFEIRRIDINNKLMAKIENIENKKFPFYSFGKANMIDYNADTSLMTLKLEYNKDIEKYIAKDTNYKYLKIDNNEAKILFQNKKSNDFFIEIKYNNQQLQITNFYIKYKNEKLYIVDKNIIKEHNKINSLNLNHKKESKDIDLIKYDDIDKTNPWFEILYMIHKYKENINSMKKDIWETNKDFENRKIDTKNELIGRIKKIEDQKFIFYSFGKVTMTKYNADTSLMTLKLKYNKDIKDKLHYLQDMNNMYLKIINTNAKRLFKDKSTHDFFIEVKYNPKTYKLDVKKFYIKDGDIKLYIHGNKKATIPQKNKIKCIDKYSLTIDIEPSDANIYIMKIKEKYKKGIKLPKGIYEIKITKNGYTTKQFEVNLNKNIHKSIRLIEDKKKIKSKIVKEHTNKYSLTIKTKPHNAHIYIMKRKIKYKKGIKLQKDTYKIKIKKRGYKTKIFTIRLDKNIHRYIKLIKYKRRRRRNTYKKPLYGDIMNYYNKIIR